MRTLIDMPEGQVGALDALARRQNRSRAALVREAIDAFLAKQRVEDVGDAFGLWGQRDVDGLIYQEKVRGEW